VSKATSIFALLCLSLAACSTPSTVADAKRIAPDRTVSIDVPLAYQALYRRLRAHYECYETIGLSTAAIRVHSELFSDTKEAEITVKQVAPAFNAVWQHLEIKSVAPDRSSIKLYVGLGPVQAATEKLKKQVSTEQVDCRA